MRTLWQPRAFALVIAACRASVAAEPRHVAVFQAAERFGGWPAHGGTGNFGGVPRRAGQEMIDRFRE